jgi:hypothetical protein
LLTCVVDRLRPVIFVSAVVIAFSNCVMSARSVAVRAVAMFVRLRD